LYQNYIIRTITLSYTEGYRRDLILYLNIATKSQLSLFVLHFRNATWLQ